MIRGIAKFSDPIFYTVLFCLLALSLSAMYMNLVVNENFYQYTIDDERPDPFKPFLYNQNNI